jgi:hypothetical protein
MDRVDQSKQFAAFDYLVICNVVGFSRLLRSHNSLSGKLDRITFIVVCGARRRPTWGELTFEKPAQPLTTVNVIVRNFYDPRARNPEKLLVWMDPASRVTLIAGMLEQRP